MYKTLVRNIVRIVVIGTFLAVFPAIPFYIYAFDATLRQLAILVPLFIPALLSMLFADLLMIWYYLRPISDYCQREESGRPLDDERLFLAKQRALNFPAYAVLRVFIPHALIGSGVFNLFIVLANRYLSLGINPADFAVYWVINLTVVPVAHAVYEYFELAKAILPTLERLDVRVPRLPEEYSSRVVTVRLATKVIVIFIMLGMAPLFILGVSLNKKHTSQLIEKEEHHLFQEAQLLSSLLPTLNGSQRQAMVSSYNGRGTVILRGADGGISFSDSALKGSQRSEIIRFLDNKTHPAAFLYGEGTIAAKVVSGNGTQVVCIAMQSDELREESASLRFGTIVIVSVSVILLGALLFLVAADINRSTKKLVAALKDLEQGSFDHDVKIYSTDEFSTIGSGFNEMIAGLRERNFIKDTFGKLRSLRRLWRRSSMKG